MAGHNAAKPHNLNVNITEPTLLASKLSDLQFGQLGQKGKGLERDTTHGELPAEGTGAKQWQKKAIEMKRWLVIIGFYVCI